uniref:Uncharacterized protein n=1 Tax=Anguilla anguilla TaxID=7936 RepID=A0A0E9SGW5_ANGAN
MQTLLLNIAEDNRLRYGSHELAG